MHASSVILNGATPNSTEEKQAQEENRAAPLAKPGGFDNDPPDPKNPNEVRERHLTKVNR